MEQVVESRVGNSGRDVGGTSPSMGEVKRSRMPEPRVVPGATTELPRKPDPRRQSLGAIAERRMSSPTPPRF